MSSPKEYRKKQFEGLAASIDGLVASQGKSQKLIDGLVESQKSQEQVDELAKGQKEHETELADLRGKVDYCVSNIKSWDPDKSSAGT